MNCRAVADPLARGKKPRPRPGEGVADVSQEFGLVVFYHDEVVPAVLDHLRQRSRWQNIASPVTTRPSSTSPWSSPSAALCSLVLAPTSVCRSVRPLPLSHHRQQVDGPLVAADTAADRFAIQGDRLPRLVALLPRRAEPAGRGLRPPRQRVLEGCRVRAR